MEELKIKIYKFYLFDKEIFLFLKDDKVNSFKFLFKLLNDRIPLEEAKKRFVEDYVNKHLPNFPYNTYSFGWIIKNFVGVEKELNQVGEFYKIVLRNIKIDDITKD